MTTETDAARRDAVFAENQQLRQRVAELEAALSDLVANIDSLVNRIADQFARDTWGVPIKRARALLSRTPR